MNCFTCRKMWSCQSEEHFCCLLIHIFSWCKGACFDPESSKCCPCRGTRHANRVHHGFENQFSSTHMQHFTVVVRDFLSQILQLGTQHSNRYFLRIACHLSKQTDVLQHFSQKLKLRHLLVPNVAKLWAAAACWPDFRGLTNNYHHLPSFFLPFFQQFCAMIPSKLRRLRYSWILKNLYEFNWILICILSVILQGCNWGAGDCGHYWSVGIAAASHGCQDWAVLHECLWKGIHQGAAKAITACEV